MYAAEFGSTGALEISVFHGLSVGNTAQPLIDPPTAPPLLPPELLPDPLPLPEPLPLPLPELPPDPLLLDPLPEPLPLPDPLLLPPSGPTTGLPLCPPLLLLESSPPQATVSPAKAPVTASMPKVRMSCDILHIEHDECVWEQALGRSMNIPSPPHVSAERRAKQPAHGRRLSASSVKVAGDRGKRHSSDGRAESQVANRGEAAIAYYGSRLGLIPSSAPNPRRVIGTRVNRQLPNVSRGHVIPRAATAARTTDEVKRSAAARNDFNRLRAHAVR